ncbi:galactokinase [Kineosporia sp. R_H_3]|uniref:galactokinase n=1 Tax=Kineosporia sp. R_H_3 TaxID=1961848 RepID=UPI000B4BFA4F|nr:galactokinase [Kineosporia sp. R_H_3]
MSPDGPAAGGSAAGRVAAQPFWYDAADDRATALAAADAFRAAYGREPDGVWAAPGRVNVIGEHVDYNGGLCMPFALPARTFAAVGSREDDVLRVRSAQVPGSGPDGGWQGALADIGPGTVEGWAGYAVGVPWALAQAGSDVPGLDVVIDGRVPLGAGLSSSAALECAVAVAVDELAGLGLGGDDAGRTRLAAACVRAENEIAGAPTGGMDQAASLRARAGSALLLDCRDFTVEHVPFDLPAHGLELLVMDTRAHHALVDGQYGSRRDACERAADVLGIDTLREVRPDGLERAAARLHQVLGGSAAEEVVRRVRHVVSEIARVREVATLLAAGRVRDVGPVLDASHTSLRDDYEVSCAELDVACEAARAAGALGARMTGGGFGGSAIALVDAARTASVAAAVATAFVDHGFDPPAFLRAVPSAAAERVL